ncbi:MAG: hypothetical protein WC117_00375 [Sphaerochaetaceae bacterium]|jgi:hypothetical protein
MIYFYYADGVVKKFTNEERLRNYLSSGKTPLAARVTHEITMSKFMDVLDAVNCVYGFVKLEGTIAYGTR